jgi:hypothetical protein
MLFLVLSLCVCVCVCARVGEIELSRFQVGSHHAPKIDVPFLGSTRCVAVS